MLTNLRPNSNIIRFPLERRARPSFELLAEIAPDIRLVGLLVEGTDLEIGISEMRDEADREMAERILNEVDPAPGPRRRQALEAMLAAIVIPAIEACRHANDAWAEREAAQRRYDDARQEGGYWLASLAERAETSARRAAGLIIDASILSEKAFGAARAIGMAKRNETWKPFDLRAEEAALFGFEPENAASA